MIDKELVKIVISIISIVVPIIVSFLSSRNEKEQSCFYTFITLGDEKFVKKTKLIRNILFVIFFAMVFVMEINSIFSFLSISTVVSDRTVSIAVIVLSLICILQRLCSDFFVLRDIKTIDKMLKDRTADVSTINLWSIVVISILICVAIVMISLLRANEEWKFPIFYGIAILLFGLSAIIESYISLYVKMRRWYYVDSICLKTKNNETVYYNLHNYKRDRYSYNFVCEHNDKYMRYNVPIDEVAVIEQTIDKSKPLIYNYIECPISNDNTEEDK